MEKLGVMAGDSRDTLNRGKFFSGNAVNLFGSNSENPWEHQYLYYGVKKVRIVVTSSKIDLTFSMLF
jgi:hypothetical protein